MKKAVYPGSFDLFTNGHLDIIQRASKLVDELHVLVADNHEKVPVFTIEERVKMVSLVTSHLPNVVVKATDQLVVNYAKENDIIMIIRGLRNLLDYVGEYRLYSFNKTLDADIETVIMFPSVENHYVSSSAIKELVAHDVDISRYVPNQILPMILEKYKKLVK